MQLTVSERLKAALPKPLKQAAAPLLKLFGQKYGSELSYWKRRHSTEGHRFENDHYRRVMLAMAGEENDRFLKGKIVADFGCGPRGSLAWLSGATTVGIDVLVPLYAEHFADDLRAHGMIYVASTEELIPMPDNSVDVMFTMNALDHAANLEAICSEIVRVMKPDAQLVASFNLNEPPTLAEPQTLTEDLLQTMLLRRFEPQSVRFGRHRQGDTYGEMFDDQSTYQPGKVGYMWFRGTRR